jgi:hypothetical protein
MTLKEYHRKLDAQLFDALKGVSDTTLAKLLTQHTNYMKYNFCPDEVVGFGKKRK